MNLAKYTELTGITVAAGDQVLVTAQINRTKAMLETMLGFTLSSSKVTENLYNELGKTQLECACPVINTDDLLDPDDIEGAYRMYSYNPNDIYFHVDPFITLHKVKLVFVRQGEDDQGITLKTFDSDQIRVDLGREGLSKYIEHCRDCLCSCGCTDCVQLAVDADWMFEDCLPKDLQYVWADMITYNVDCKKDVKSETITTHAYTKFDRVLPEMMPQNFAVIQRYAGPYGSVTRMLTT